MLLHIPFLSFPYRPGGVGGPPADPAPVQPKPKRQLSAFMVFCAQKRAEASAEAKQRGNAKDAARILADWWKKIEDEDLQHFRDLAAAENAKRKQG